MEIDARGETFQEFEDFGNQLIQNQHYENENIRIKLEEMQKARDSLEWAWKQRQEKLDQCLELQLFNRDCETAEQWMKSRENALNDDHGGKNGTEWVAAIKCTRRKKYLIYAINHYDSANVQVRIAFVLERWQKLRQSLLEYRSKLGEKSKYFINLLGILNIQIIFYLFKIWLEMINVEI